MNLDKVREKKLEERIKHIIPVGLTVATALTCGLMHQDVVKAKNTVLKQSIISVQDELADTVITPVVDNPTDIAGNNTEQSMAELKSKAQELAKAQAELDKKIAEEKARKEAEEKARKEAEERARREAEERARLQSYNSQSFFSDASSYGTVTRTLDTAVGGGSGVVSLGVKQAPSAIYQYLDIIEASARKFNIDPNVLLSLLSQESGGDIYCDTATSAGIAQIDACLETNFVNFGRDVYGQEWDLNDRYNPKCAIPYCAYTLSTYLTHYNGDYLKAIQAYNFSHYSLDKLISAFGDDWINHTHEIAYYNGHYAKTGSTRYGDPNYVRNVLGFYSDII